MATRTRSRAPARKPKPLREIPPKAELARLKISAEVAYYLVSRGIPFPDCPPLHKTPEAGEVSRRARFDPERVDRVLASFHHLRHTKGKWAGRPLDPDPWQVAYVIAPTFGWVHRNDSGAWVRVVQELYVDVSRKNGKSTLLGGLGIYLTCADGEPGAEVITAATTKDQAGFVFGPVKTLAEKSPALKPHVRATAHTILHTASGSTFKVISNVADAQHGANLHGAVVDELHVHKSAEMVETLETGTGSRDQPLICFITTADAGKPNTIYDRKRSLVERLASRVITNPVTYGVIWAADYEDQFGDRPFQEETWRKANPGFGVSPTREYLAKAATAAQNSPAELSSFLRLHLGIRTKQRTRYIPLEAWDATAGMVDETELEGLACRGGLDLSSVEDLTGLCWDFRTPDSDQHRVIWRFWLPEDRLGHLNRRTAGNAEVWVRNGWLTLTPGNVIDNDAIVSRVLKDADRFDVESLGYDRWGANDVVRRLGDEGLTCVPIGQGYASMSAPMKELLRLVLRGNYVHGGNPVARWCVDNLAVLMDADGNVKPDRENSGDKIDGVAAALDALKEHLDAEAEEENVIMW
jgi:phage terminase large subunit-like protein